MTKKVKPIPVSKSKSKSKYTEKIFSYTTKETKDDLYAVIDLNELEMSELVRTILNYNLYISKVSYPKMRDELIKRKAALK